MDERRLLMIEHAKVFWDGFYRCPTTGRIIEAMQGDDKVLCNCGTSNPKVPTESTDRTGVHIRRFLATATVEEYVDQMLARRAALRK